MNIKSFTNKLLDVGLIYLILYTFFGFVFSRSALSSSTFVYLSFASLLLVFVAAVLLNNLHRPLVLDISAIIWIPFFIFVIVSYFFNGDYEHFSYWTVCLSILLLAVNCNLKDKIPYELFCLIGLFAIIGIIIQLVFPSFYINRIASFYDNTNQLIYWHYTYGFAGFSYQLDITAMQILYAEGVVLCFRDKNGNGGNIKTIIIIAIMLAGISMTGKRMISLVSIVTPMLVILISNKKQSKKIAFIISSIIILTLGLIYVFNHASELVSNSVLRRFAESIIRFQAGDNISSGRSSLYDMAWAAFRSSPIIGIGVSNFVSYTGAYTEAHNSYLQVLCEMGLVGFTVYIIPLVATLIITIRELKQSSSVNEKYLQFSLFCQITYLLYSFSGNTNSNMFGFVMYFISIAIMISSRNKRQPYVNSL